MTKYNLTTFILLLFTISINAQFSACPDQKSFNEFKSSLCTTVKAPLDHSAKNGQKIDLFVRKFPAIKKRLGSIWLIPGGPGESGASMYPLVAQFSKIFPHLDIFIPDHRGTGKSGKICPDQESLESPNGIALAGNEWGPCFEYMYSNRAYVQAFTITNAANDLGMLINDLSGNGKRYIYGVSYGTQLVLRLLQLDLVSFDGVILDSLVPLQDDVDYDLSHRSFVVNEIGNSVLDFYNKSDSNNSGSLTTQLQNVIKKSRTDDNFSKKLPKQDLSILFGMMLDIPEIRNNIPNIIKALTKENVEPLNNAIENITAFYTSYGAKYSTSPSSIPLVQVISSSENNLRPTLKKSEIVEESKNLLFSSLLPGLMAENSMPTYKRDTYFSKIPEKLPPTLIVHGTLDPKTHHKGAIRYFKKLSKDNEVSFISIKDAPHFIALFAPESFASVTTKFINNIPLTNKTITDKDTLLK